MTGRSVTRLIDCFERGIYLRPWAKMILYNNMRIFVKGNIGKITEMQEEHKKKLMASHEFLAEMKLRKTEMSVRH